jgi:flavin-dependent dehydrogenase
VLVGDAFGFLDPVYSSGILLALKSGEMAADTIDEAIQENDLSGKRLGSFGPKLSAGMEAFRNLIYAFYTPTFSFRKFVKNHPEHRDNLVDLLCGDVFEDKTQAMFPTLSRYCDLPEPMSLASTSSQQH